MSSLIGKARKPKFELHLKIYDLNNVPLISGSSFVKWHLGHSMNAEHRGRTHKCAIANHRVDYSYCTQASSIRISIDRSNNLAECPIEFEVIQEFAVTEKIVLGTVRLNLSEYVEESEAFIKEVASPGRMRSGSFTTNPSNSTWGRRDSDVVEDGIVRRYLMQDSKVNSTLKIGILMCQVDGERSYIAPPLKTAPVFGGIAGIMAGETVEDDAVTGPIPNFSKPRDAAELQDLYRRTLAASWCRQANELPADECIEDIFNGGNGWKTKPAGENPTDEDDDFDSDLEHHNGTLRPGDYRRMTHPHQNRARSHRRSPSVGSDKSVSTVTVTAGNHHRKAVTINYLDHSRSLASLASSMSMDSDRLREGGYKKSREIDEFEIRNDLIAWTLPEVDSREAQINSVGFQSVRW